MAEHEYQLPTRNDNNYLIIDKFKKDYQYTHKIIYEFARRNENIMVILNILFELFGIYEQHIFPKLVEYKKADNLLKKEIFKDYENEAKNIYLVFFKHYKKEEFIDAIKDLNFENIESKLKKIVNTLTDELYNKYYIIYMHDELIKNEYLEIYDPTIYSKKEKNLLNPIEKHFEDIQAYDNNIYTYNVEEHANYSLYQAINKISHRVVFNTIYPRFSMPIRDFSDTQIILNINLPINEITDYIEIIKKDYEKRIIKPPIELLISDDSRNEENTFLKDKFTWADMFFIYDYYLISKTFENKTELEIQKEIQIELTKFHGIKVKKEENEIKNTKDLKYKLVPLHEHYKDKEDIDFNEFDDEKAYISNKSIKNKYLEMLEYIERDNPKYKTIITK